MPFYLYQDAFSSFLLVIMRKLINQIFDFNRIHIIKDPKSYGATSLTVYVSLAHDFWWWSINYCIFDSKKIMFISCKCISHLVHDDERNILFISTLTLTDKWKNCVRSNLLTFFLYRKCNHCCFCVISQVTKHCNKMRNE